MTIVEILHAAPMMTVQDIGRPGMLRHGVAASGPMDRSAYHRAGSLLKNPATTCIEFGAGRVVLRIIGGQVKATFCGASFELTVGKTARAWESAIDLSDGDQITITPREWGNWGLVRFDQEIDVPQVMGSGATNLIAGLGGLQGRCLRARDQLKLAPHSIETVAGSSGALPVPSDQPIRVIWGIHAGLFSSQTREAFLSHPFIVSAKLDRMGIQLTDLEGVFANQSHLSLVSDVVVPGDIQILGDGTPVVLMRDHQPTGGYPRIATVIGPDIDRLAQMRPGRGVRFTSVTVDRAHSLTQSGGVV